MTRRLVEGTKELCSLWGRASWDHSPCPELPLGPNPGGSMPFAPALPVCLSSEPRPVHGALSYASSLFPVGGRLLALACPGAQYPAEQTPGGPQDLPLEWLVWLSQHPLPSVCLPTASTLPLPIQLVPPRSCLLPRPFLMPQPSEHPLFLLPQSPSGSQRW